MFGASNPPPAIWDAYERMKARIVDPQMEKEKGWRLGKTQAKKDEGVVLAFAKVHFAEVTEVEMVGLQSRGFRSDSSVALGPRSTSTLALASLRGVAGRSFVIAEPGRNGRTLRRVARKEDLGSPISSIGAFAAAPPAKIGGLVARSAVLGFWVRN